MAGEMDQRIENLVSPALEEIGIELLEIEYRKEHGDQMLRLFIDHDEGVNLNTCTLATRAIQDLIEQEKIKYDHLEISSPGFNRLLKKDKDFIKFQGERVKVRTIQPLEGQKNFQGLLRAVDEQELNLEIEGEIKSIPRVTISIVRLDPEI